MSTEKEIRLPCYGITITDYGQGVASIDGNLHDPILPDDDDDERNEKMSFNDMMDAITSLILAHHCAGIDVTSPAYLEGIETAVQACEQNT